MIIIGSSYAYLYCIFWTLPIMGMLYYDEHKKEMLSIKDKDKNVFIPKSSIFWALTFIPVLFSSPIPPIKNGFISILFVLNIGFTPVLMYFDIKWIKSNRR